MKEVAVDKFIYQIIHLPNAPHWVLALCKWIRDEACIKPEKQVKINIY